MTDTKPDLRSIAGGGIASWSGTAQKGLRQTLEDLLSEYEQILIVGIRRDPKVPAETETMYGYQYRPGRTSMDEFIGSLHKLVRQLESESRREGGDE